MKMIEFKSILCVLISGCSYVFGGLDQLVITFLIFIVVDFVTGIIIALKEKKLSSEVCVNGILKKMMYIVVIFVAVQIDLTLELNGLLRTVTLSMFIGSEGISILENCALMGVPIPQKIIDVLEQLKSEGDYNGLDS